MQLILASTSPWRRQLLASVGLGVDGVAPGVAEEEFSEDRPVERAIGLARLKAEAVAARSPGALVIGADQVAHLNGENFGKPKNPDDHLRRLRALRGRGHRLVTGVALIGPGIEVLFSEETEVVFRADLSDEELEAYVLTGEGSGCAGGYQAEGQGAALIERVNGDWFNVIGLPVHRLLGALRGLGWRPFGLHEAPPQAPTPLMRSGR